MTTGEDKMKTMVSAGPGGGKGRKGAPVMGGIFAGRTAFVFSHKAAGKQPGQRRDLMDIFAAARLEGPKKPARQLSRPAHRKHPGQKNPAKKQDDTRHEDAQRFYGDLAHVLSRLLALDGIERHGPHAQAACVTDEQARRLLMKMMQPGRAYLGTRFKAKARGVANRKSPRAEMRIRTRRTHHRRARHRHIPGLPMTPPFPGAIRHLRPH